MPTVVSCTPVRPSVLVGKVVIRFSCSAPDNNAPEGCPMIVDSHTHLFAADQQRYPLFDPTAAYRPTAAGSVELLKEQMDAAGVDRAVTISPWPYRWDMSYVLDVLPANRDWLAVAVLVDPISPDG